MLILCGWITRLPEVLAYLAFELVTLVPLLICLWLMLPRRFAIIPLLIAPAFLMNFGSGQTGFFPALAYAGGALLMDSNPIAAGMSLGLLLFKPHFALLVPLVLAASANWRAFFACGATAAGLAALSLLAFPVQVWIEFFNQPGLMKYMLEHGSNILLSVGPFGALRAAGASLPLAYTIQALTAAVVLTLLLIAASKTARHEPASSQRRSGRGLIALTAAGSVLFSPYAQDYDLSVTMVPVVWLAACALRTGWRPWEKLIAALVYLLPLFARITVLLTHVQPAPVLLLAFFVLIWRRTGQDRTRTGQDRNPGTPGEVRHPPKPGAGFQGRAGIGSGGSLTQPPARLAAHTRPKQRNTWKSVSRASDSNRLNPARSRPNAA